MNNDTFHDRDHHDRDRELLSALMDGETSEHELRQALRAVADDAALAQRWQRYHMAQSALRGEAGGFAHIDLRAVVAGRLDESADMYAAGGPGAPGKASVWRQASWLKPLASVAVAASMAVVTVFAWQALRPGVPVAGESVVAGTVAAPAAGAQTVALGPMVMVREDGEELLLPDDQSGSPAAGQDRLNAYLARHAQAASQASNRGLAPYARVVSLAGEAGR